MTPVFGSVLVRKHLEVRQDPDNIVFVTDTSKFW